MNELYSIGHPQILYTMVNEMARVLVPKLGYLGKVMFKSHKPAGLQSSLLVNKTNKPTRAKPSMFPSVF